MKKLLIANWKLNKNASEIVAWFDEFSAARLRALGSSSTTLDIVLCPSTPYLYIVSEIIKKYDLQTVYSGAQDVSQFVSGSHTGEASVSQVKEFCNYSIVGHSERAEPFEVVQAKIKNCIDTGIIPIVCLRDVAGFKKLMESDVVSRNYSILEKLILVWEDPSNISKDGVYNTPSASKLEHEVKEIREVIGERGLVYGGSVNEDNIDFLLSEECNFLGYLVGHASLSAKSFSEVAKKILQKA